MQRLMLYTHSHGGGLDGLLAKKRLGKSPVASGGGGVCRCRCARRQLYKNGILKTREKHPPVLVVGNIVTGGAGKTPLVIALLLALKKRGLNPGPLRAVSAVILTAYGKSIPMMIGGVVAMKHCLSTLDRCANLPK